MNYKTKIERILGVTGWSRDKLADLLLVSNGALGRWLKGKAIKSELSRRQLDQLYAAIVEPLLCEIERRADAAEKTMLRARIKALPEDNACR